MNFEIERHPDARPLSVWNICGLSIIYDDYVIVWCLYFWANRINNERLSDILHIEFVEDSCEFVFCNFMTEVQVEVQELSASLSDVVLKKA